MYTMVYGYIVNRYARQAIKVKSTLTEKRTRNE